ncbi:MAG: DUF533 domain-containing protein [Robiginitomaculum sp.]
MPSADMSKSVMDAQAFLEQIFATGKELAAKGKASSGPAIAKATKKSKALAKQGEDILVEKLGVEDSALSRETLRKGVATGAAAGALALLLASRSGRKLAVVGGLAGLGTIAYKAYEKNGGKMPGSVSEAIGILKGEKSVYRSQALIAAMIAAAKADGTIDDAELAFIRAHESVDADALKIAIEASPDAKAIAKLSDSPQAAREIYAVSCRVANGLNPKERDYLDALAMALKLDPELAARIETDMRTGS